MIGFLTEIALGFLGAAILVWLGYRFGVED